MEERFQSESEDETYEIGRTFAERLQPDAIVLLYGDLGAGKTSFVKGVCSYFQVEDIVSSPTFTIINQYDGETPDGDETTLYHVDLYRIKSVGDLKDIGFRDCLYAPDAIKLVEWPENAGDILPDTHWTVHIEFAKDRENGRAIVVVGAEEGDG